LELAWPLAQLREGAPSVTIGVLVAGIFVFAECGAVFAGYAVFGRYLGVRTSSADGQ
jgi:hypothetical protein